MLGQQHIVKETINWIQDYSTIFYFNTVALKMEIILLYVTKDFRDWLVPSQLYSHFVFLIMGWNCEYISPGLLCMLHLNVLPPGSLLWPIPAASIHTTKDWVQCPPQHWVLIPLGTYYSLLNLPPLYAAPHWTCKLLENTVWSIQFYLLDSCAPWLSTVSNMSKVLNWIKLNWIDNARDGN